MNSKSKNTKKSKPVKKKVRRVVGKSRVSIRKLKDYKNNIKKEEIDKIFSDFKLKLSVLKQKQNLIVSKFLDDLKERQIQKIKDSINF